MVCVLLGTWAVGGGGAVDGVVGGFVASGYGLGLVSGFLLGEELGRRTINLLYHTRVLYQALLALPLL